MTEPISYVLPILRQASDDAVEELTRYLKWMSDRAEVIVADGSSADVYAEHDDLWGSYVEHLPVANQPGRYGKVTGVHVGVAAASHEKVVIADDDVRYDDDSFARIAETLRSADLVRPQNYFHPLPWHAAWDTARILLNRAMGSDSPGTLAIRRSFFVRMGGYADDVLYENLELIRTVSAHGGRVADRPDIYVRRLPSTTRRFFEQRPRQAYDDFSQPTKMAAFLIALPALVAAYRSRGPADALGAAMAAVAVAEVGRRRHAGKLAFPARAIWWAPAWLVERAICVWLAVAYRLTGGVPYAGTKLAVAAHSPSELRRRAASHLMAPVAQGSRPGTSATAQGDD